MSDEQVRETLASLSGVPVGWQLVNDDGVARLMVRLTPEVQMIGVEVRAEPTPEPETCGAEHPSGNYWCTLAVHGDDEPHRCVYQGRELARWHEPTPEPVPQWRRLVDAMPPKPFAERHPLAEILERLAVLDEYSDTGVVDETRLYQMNIARIVAVCEQQVGDGWQADPNVEQVGTAWVLLNMFTEHSPRFEIGAAPATARWMNLGNYAASWLAHLTGEAS